MRTLSTLAKTELNKRSGGDCWLWIVEISNGTSTIRITENTQNVVFGGNTYYSFPFVLDLPADVDDGLPDGTLAADHTDRSIYDLIVGQTQTPTMKIGLVLGAQQTVTELAGGSLVNYKIGGYVVDEQASTITLQITMDIAYDEPFTSHCFDKGHFPKLFIKVADQ